MLYIITQYTVVIDTIIVKELYYKDLIKYNRIKDAKKILKNDLRKYRIKQISNGFQY